jgi:hypothetical protein
VYEFFNPGMKFCTCVLNFCTQILGDFWRSFLTSGHPDPTPSGLQANRDAGIREAECEKAAMDVKYNTDTKIEDNSRAFKLQKANFDKEVNTAVSRPFSDIIQFSTVSHLPEHSPIGLRKDYGTCAIARRPTSPLRVKFCPWVRS